MITEDWKPRYNDGQNSEGQNRERRPYNSNRSNYNNQGSYGRTDHRNNYNRPNSDNYNSYRNEDNGYHSRPSYNREGGYNNNRSGGYDRSSNYNRNTNDGYERSNNYNRNTNDGYDRPQRQYDRSSDYSNDGLKKRRPRVGDTSTRVTGGGGGYGNNYGDRPSRPQGGNYQRQGNRPPSPRLKGKSTTPNPKYGSFPKQQKYREENWDPEELIRLNKYLANAGICSRREADEFIKAGLVSVNGVTVNEVGTKVKRSDEVTFHNESVKLEHKIYLLLNKPRNCVTTADDPQERLTVMDLVKTACQERIFPVGRLDRNTTGVLLLTNDGDLSSKLTHPKYLKKKIYHVWLDKEVNEDDMQKLADGVELEDGEIHADAISYVNDDAKDQVGIEIHSGKNRIVRRMFEHLGYHVIKLDRVYFAGLTKKNLKKGHWRFLSDQEVAMLRMGSFE